MVSAIQIGFYIAGAYNCCILFPSRFLSDTLADVDPNFSGMTCKLILLWGLAYISIAERFEVAPLTCLVFAVEKLLYVIHWLYSLPSYDIWVSFVSLYFGSCSKMVHPEFEENPSSTSPFLCWLRYRRFYILCFLCLCCYFVFGKFVRTFVAETYFALLNSD